LKIRGLRKNAELTQEELAEKSGLHTTFIAHIELGNKACSIKSMEKIANALLVSVHSLLQGEKKTNYEHKKVKLLSYIMDKSDSEKELIYKIAKSIFEKNKKPKNK
jgi:transcriptional regulator with XRE-family HTH domain